MKSGVKPSYLLYLLTVVYFNGVTGQESPCPDVFDYEFDGTDYFGAITLPSVGRGRTNLMITLSVEDTLTQDNSGQLLLLNDIKTVYATVDTGGLLKYKVVFPNSEHIPIVKSIKLNKIEHCSNPAGSTIGVESIITIKHSFQTDVNGVQSQSPQIQPRPQPQPVPRPQPQPVPRPQLVPEPASLDLETNFRPAHVQSGNDVSWLGTLATSGTCGFRKIPGDGNLQTVHTIINGFKAGPGEYPWLVALHDQAMKFICGGTLVSNSHVITAAHCIQLRWLFVHLGRYNIKDDTEDTILRTTKNIAVHEDYKVTTGGHADIAVLTLSEEVRFTDKIKPICLWSFGTGGIGMKGSVVGWGIDLSGDLTPEVMQTVVEIVSQGSCRDANKLFQGITSGNTYCAGGHGTGPCKGDSGGGMYIQMGNRWYLRGIVSTSLGPNSESCNVDLFAVYTDVATYLDWLKTKLE